MSKLHTPFFSRARDILPLNEKRMNFCITLKSISHISLSLYNIETKIAPVRSMRQQLEFFGVNDDDQVTIV